MRFGPAIFPADETTAPGDFGRLAEDRRFEGIALIVHRERVEAMRALWTQGSGEAVTERFAG